MVISLVFEQQRVIRTWMIFIDLVLTNIAFIGAYWLRFYSRFGPVAKSIPPWQMYIGAIVFVNLVWFLLLNLWPVHAARRKRTIADELWNLTLIATLGALVLMAATFLYRDISYSRLVLSYFWFLDIALMFVGRLAARILLRYRYARGKENYRILLIGGSQDALELAQRLKEEYVLGCTVVGILDDDHNPTDLEGYPDLSYLGLIKDFERVASEYQIHAVVIVLPLEEYGKVKKILDYCGKEGIDVRIVPKFLDFLDRNAMLDDVGGIYLLGLRPPAMREGFNRVGKRALDIIFSAAVLVLLSPVFAIIAVGVKLSSPGPVLFVQERIGLNNKPFKMYKFRTMRVQAKEQSDRTWTTSDDARKTKFGFFLRRTSLDELPQFFNVLIGNMSVVGPRPERPYFVDKFKEQIPHYMARHNAKAGITGWAQVNGLRGDTSIARRIEADIYYQRHWSLWLDLKIIWLTVFRTLRDKNAY